MLLWKWVSSSAVVWCTAIKAANTLWRRSVTQRSTCINNAHPLLHPLFSSAGFYPFYAELWCRRLNLFLTSVELECLHSGSFCKSHVTRLIGVSCTAAWHTASTPVWMPAGRWLWWTLLWISYALKQASDAFFHLTCPSLMIIFPIFRSHSTPSWRTK